jgi:cysteine dioxygenase
MDVLPPRLTLDEFMLEMGREPVSSLTQERLMDLTHRLSISAELIESRTCFSPNPYARNLVCRTPAFELLVLCWRPGHESTIHDHVGSLNAISVFAGELTSRLFRPVASRPAGAGPVEMTSEDRLRPGQGWIGVDRSGIHQLANTGSEDLVTVHVYAPALMELTIYSTESPEVERRPLRYTLAEDLA